VDAVRLARHPLLHFLLLGALLFTADRARAPQAPRLPDGRSAEQVLLDEALARGYERSDPIARRRLQRNARFLHPDDPRDDEALLQEAYALGLQRSDLVVRRRLIQKMKLLAWSRADADEPGEPELRAAFALRPARWREPARVRISHVYLSRDARGPRLESDARALEPLLEGRSPDDAAALGDPFLLGAQLPALREAELAARLGGDLARVALAAQPGRWSGPARSAYGAHWIWVHQRWPARDLAFEEARPALRSQLRRQRRDQAVRRLVGELRG
jgi:hypothetical protein